MLYALDSPLSLAVLLMSFIACVTVSGWVSSVVAARSGQRGLKQEGRTRPDPRRHVDPFGAVSAAIAGFGWSKPVDVPRTGAARVATAVLSGPLVLLAVGLGALVGFEASYDVSVGAFVNAVGGSNLLQEGLSDIATGQEVWLLSALMATYVGGLSLIPLPPLPGGQVLFALAPRTLGWQKAEFQLVERNIGTAVLLALVLIPLGGPEALLPNILNNLLGPLVELLTGG